MDELNVCICQLLGTLIGGVWNAMAESDAFSVTTDLGGLSSQGGMQAAAVTQPRLPATVGPGAPGDAAAADATSLAEPASVGTGGVTPAQIAALIILVAVVLMTFLQGSTSSTPAASKRRRGGGGGGDSGRDGETGHHREGPSVA